MDAGVALTTEEVEDAHNILIEVGLVMVTTENHVLTTTEGLVPTTAEVHVLMTAEVKTEDLTTAKNLLTATTEGLLLKNKLSNYS